MPPIQRVDRVYRPAMLHNVSLSSFLLSASPPSPSSSELASHGTVWLALRHSTRWSVGRLPHCSLGRAIGTPLSRALRHGRLEP